MKTAPGFSVLIPDGESNHSLPVVQQLSVDASIRINVLSTDADAIVGRSRFCHRFETVGEDLVDAVAAVTERHQVDVIMPVSERGITAASERKDEFERIAHLVRLPSPNAMALTMDKWRFAEKLVASGLPTPRTWLLDNDLDMSRLDWPLLAKPIFGHAGNGIRRVRDLKQLNALVGSSALPTDGSFILQSFIDGYDIDCSFLAVNGELAAYTIQKGLLAGKRKFSAPDAIEFLRSDRVEVLVSDLVRKLAWNGVGHADLRVGSSGHSLYVIELNPRFWASLHGSLKAGINFPMLLAYDALGMEVEPAAYDVGKYMSFDAWLRRFGVVRRKTGVTWIGPHRTSLGLVLRDPMPHLRALRRGLGRQGTDENSRR